MYGKKMGAKKVMSKSKRMMPMEMTKKVTRTLQPMEVQRPKRTQANPGQARAKMAGMKAALYNKKPR